MPTPSNAVITPGDQALAPMRVKFDSIDLGGTLNNIVLAMAISKGEIKSDQTGAWVLDRRISGGVFTITTALAEFRNQDNWLVVFPGATTKLTTGGTAILFDIGIGTSDLANARSLILHPLDTADATLDFDINAPKAIASEESEITHGPADQSMLNIVWNILPDTGSGPPFQVLRFGDPAATV